MNSKQKSNTNIINTPKNVELPQICKNTFAPEGIFHYILLS